MSTVLLIGEELDFIGQDIQQLDEIEWNEKLIGLIGARGVGKTTLMLQHLTENTTSREETLYITIDNLAMSLDSLFSLAETFYKSGGKRLYIDEIHKLFRQRQIRAARG